MKTINEIRNAFWNDHRLLREKYFTQHKRQNNYPTDVRVAFVDYVDMLSKDGMISEKLANRVTL